jgi:hypothetical protein
MGEQIYVIAGKEESLVNARRRELIDHLLGPEDRMMGLLSVDSAQALISDVLDERRRHGR